MVWIGWAEKSGLCPESLLPGVKGMTIPFQLKGKALLLRFVSSLLLSLTCFHRAGLTKPS